MSDLAWYSGGRLYSHDCLQMRNASRNVEASDFALGSTIIFSVENVRRQGSCFCKRGLRHMGLITNVMSLKRFDLIAFLKKACEIAFSPC